MFAFGLPGKIWRGQLLLGIPCGRKSTKRMVRGSVVENTAYMEPENCRRYLYRTILVGKFDLRNRSAFELPFLVKMLRNIPHRRFRSYGSQVPAEIFRT